MQLMTASEWKRSSSAGLFARRNNKILKQIDWLVERYHQIDPAKHLERKACLVAIVGQCSVWIESKRGKSSSSRMPAVIALRDQAEAVSERAKERWGKLRKLFVGEKSTTGGVAKPLHGAKPIQVENSVPSQWDRTVNEYWLEAYGDDHIMGRELKEPFQRWLQLPEGEERSFWDWLKQQPEYKSLKSTSSVTYLDAQQRRDYELQIVGQQLCAGSDEAFAPYDTRDFGSALAMSQGAGLAIYVLSPDQKLYSAEGSLGLMHHSSFLSGAPVLAAGEIRCENGYIKRITGQSGHYRPGRDFAFNFLLYLKRKGVALRGIRSEIPAFGIGDAEDHYRLLLKEFKSKMKRAATNMPSNPMLVQAPAPGYMMMGKGTGVVQGASSTPMLPNSIPSTGLHTGNHYATTDQVLGGSTQTVHPVHTMNHGVAPAKNFYSQTQGSPSSSGPYSITEEEPDARHVEYSITRV